MKHLPKVCLWPRTKPLNLAVMILVIIRIQNQDYDDYFRRGLLSLFDCLWVTLGSAPINVIRNDGALQNIVFQIFSKADLNRGISHDLITEIISYWSKVGGRCPHERLPGIIIILHAGTTPSKQDTQPM